MKTAGTIIKTSAGLAATAVILICVMASGAVSNAARNRTLCSGISVVIKDSTESRFVSGSDIIGYISEEYGKTTGLPVRDLDLKKMEKILDSQSAVLKSEAYCTKDGILHIGITQRKPVMRFQKNGAGFYADLNGYIFPMEPGKASYVVVIDGNIPLDPDKAGKGRSVTGKERQWLDRITDVVSYMESHSVWADDIVQIHVLENGDLVLIPREGREKFIFGKPVKVNEKFALMECYYSSIVPAKGKDAYRTVDIRYDGQIICK